MATGSQILRDASRREWAHYLDQDRYHPLRDGGRRKQDWAVARLVKRGRLESQHLAAAERFERLIDKSRRPTASTIEYAGRTGGFSDRGHMDSAEAANAVRAARRAVYEAVGGWTPEASVFEAAFDGRRSIAELAEIAGLSRYLAEMALIRACEALAAHFDVGVLDVAA